VPDLYPTKTRLALVDHIRHHRVITNVLADDDTIVLFPDAPTSWQDQVTVTFRVREMEAAGWVESYCQGVEWRLTGVGQAIHAEHGGGRG
jgi:hypothetical protein